MLAVLQLWLLPDGKGALFLPMLHTLGRITPATIPVLLVYKIAVIGPRLAVIIAPQPPDGLGSLGRNGSQAARVAV